MNLKLLELQWSGLSLLSLQMDATINELTVNHMLNVKFIHLEMGFSLLKKNLLGFFSL